MVLRGLEVSGPAVLRSLWPMAAHVVIHLEARYVDREW